MRVTLRTDKCGEAGRLRFIQTTLCFLALAIPGSSLGQVPEVSWSDTVAIELVALQQLQSVLPEGPIKVDGRRSDRVSRHSHREFVRHARPDRDNQILEAATGLSTARLEDVERCTPRPVDRCDLPGLTAFITLGIPRVMGDSARLMAIVSRPKPHRGNGHQSSVWDRDFLIELVRTKEGWRVTRSVVTRIT